MEKNRILALCCIATICFGITSCNSDGESKKDKGSAIELNVYNCADYICEDPYEVDGITYNGVIDQFEKEMAAKGYNVKVNYSTYETNEDMYNQLKAGGVRYDLICPSDYMIEKLVMNDMLEKLTVNIENYDTYGSPYVKDTFNNIKTHTKDNQEVPFSTYSVPYMWGTMGFMYDPNPKGLDESIDMFDSVSTWDVIWNENFKNKSSLKDSIRDTYIVGTFHVYKEELNLAKQILENALNNPSLSENEKEEAKEAYNAKVTEVMNRCDDDTLSYVEAALKSAKENVYEFEVDTGKEHIVKGDYWINLCWSGDAVYALDLAEEEDVLLNYVVPKEGSNVWFDGWCMPKGANVEYAQMFMDFICRPDIAAQNMNYIGYTSAIAGQSMWELVTDWYECDEEELEEATDYDLTYFFSGTGIVDEDNNPIESFVIHTAEQNRQLYAQYPDQDTITRCAVMKDFGDQNDKASEMWIRVKGNSTSVAIYIFLGLMVALVVFFEIKGAKSKRARKNRSKSK